MTFCHRHFVFVQTPRVPTNVFLVSRFTFCHSLSRETLFSCQLGWHKLRGVCIKLGRHATNWAEKRKNKNLQKVPRTSRTWQKLENYLSCKPSLSSQRLFSRYRYFSQVAILLVSFCLGKFVLHGTTHPSFCHLYREGATRRQAEFSHFIFNPPRTLSVFQPLLDCLQP